MKTNDELRKDVMNEIKWVPALRNVAAEIGVASKDCVITLSGTKPKQNLLNFLNAEFHSASFRSSSSARLFN